MAFSGIYQYPCQLFALAIHKKCQDIIHELFWEGISKLTAGLTTRDTIMPIVPASGGENLKA